MKPFHRNLVFIALALALVALGYYLDTRPPHTETESYRVVQVIDGDTILINDPSNSKVRYLGIDAPEIPLEDAPGEPMSLESWELNKKLVGGKDIELRFDKQKYDRYGRLLAYVYVDGVSLSEELVRTGNARVLVIEPNDLYADSLYEAEQSAKEQKRGIWGPIDQIAPPGGNSKFLIKPKDASRYVDRLVVLRGNITDTRANDNVVALEIGDDVELIIYNSDLDNFEFFDIDPFTHYFGKDVEAIGRVRMYRGKPMLTIEHPISLRVLN